MEKHLSASNRCHGHHLLAENVIREKENGECGGIKFVAGENRRLRPRRTSDGVTEMGTLGPSAAVESGRSILSSV